MTDLIINFSGATITLAPYGETQYTISGSGTLAANYIINFSGTLINGYTLIFYFKAEVDKASYNFNILGTNLSTTQLNRESTIIAVYNGTNWDLNIQPNTKSINWINPNDLMSGGNLDVINIPVSFDSGEMYEVEIPMPYSCNVNIMFFRVTKDFAATDAATIKLYDGVTQMGSTMTIPLSTVQGTGFQTFINYAYTTSGIYSTIKIEPAKTTAGGQGILSIIVERV